MCRGRPPRLCTRRVAQAVTVIFASPLTLTLQLVTHQLKTDAALVDMVEQMRNACKFTTAANKLDDQSQLLKPIVKDLLAEIADCARFVQDYAKHGFTGACSLHPSIHRD